MKMYSSKYIITDQPRNNLWIYGPSGNGDQEPLMFNKRLNACYVSKRYTFCNRGFFQRR